jgi:hypothetical protein
MGLFKLILVFGVLYFDYSLFNANPVLGIAAMIIQLLIYTKIKGKFLGIPLKKKQKTQNTDTNTLLLLELMRMQQQQQNSYANDAAMTQQRRQAIGSSGTQMESIQSISRRLNQTNNLEIIQSLLANTTQNQTISKYSGIKNFMIIFAGFTSLLGGLILYQLTMLPPQPEIFQIYGGILLAIAGICVYVYRHL